VNSGDPQFVLSNDPCTGKTLAPSGSPGNTCTFDVTATAPAVCNTLFGPAPFDVIGFPLAFYIHLDVQGECP
jgi:hypothetical protein